MKRDLQKKKNDYFKKFEKFVEESQIIAQMTVINYEFNVCVCVSKRKIIEYTKKDHII